MTPTTTLIASARGGVSHSPSLPLRASAAAAAAGDEQPFSWCHCREVNAWRQTMLTAVLVCAVQQHSRTSSTSTSSTSTSSTRTRTSTSSTNSSRTGERWRAATLLQGGRRTITSPSGQSSSPIRTNSIFKGFGRSSVLNWSGLAGQSMPSALQEAR